MSEAQITINGYLLRNSESMTIRCALENFAVDLQNNGMGDDDHGKTMTAAYLLNIDQIRKLIVRNNT